MAPMAAALSPQEVTDVIAFLTYGQSSAPAQWYDAIACSADKRTVNTAAPVVSNGFGIDGRQNRMLTAKQAGLTKGDMKNLEVAWAIAFPGQGLGTGAAVLGDTIFTMRRRPPAGDRHERAARSETTSPSRNTPQIADIGGSKVLALCVGRDIVVVDARTGEQVWKADPARQRPAAPSAAAWSSTRIRSSCRSRPPASAPA